MRYLVTWIALLIALVPALPASVLAEDGQQTAGMESAAVLASDEQERLELSKELHKYISVSDRINNAIDAVSAQLPESEQEGFRTSMRTVLNYRVIEKTSIDTMAELFTVDELKYLIEYHKNPMSKTVEKKFALYEQEVSPEITRMLDKSMMRVRTGGDATP